MIATKVIIKIDSTILRKLIFDFLKMRVDTRLFVYR